MKRLRTRFVVAGLVVACGVVEAAAAPGRHDRLQQDAASKVVGPAAKPAHSEKVTYPDTQWTKASGTPAAPMAKIEAHADLVLVDVVVTHRGRHVKGLTKSCFRVFDNGKPQRITVFEEHGAESPQAAHEASGLPKLPPGVYSNSPVLPESGAATVLLLDALNTPVIDQLYVRRQMVKLLASLPRGAPLAIFALGTQLRMVQGFNASTGALADAMRASRLVRASPVLRPEYAAELEREGQEVMELGATQTGLQALRQFEADQTSMRTDLRVKMTLQAMDELAAYLKLVPGRKNLIWVSGSFPVAIYRNETLPAPLEPEREYSQELAWTAALMSAARVAVYPVEAEGLTELPSTSAMESSSDSANVMNNNAMQALARGGKAKNGMNLTSSTTGTVMPGTFAEPSMAMADWKFLQMTQRERESMQALARDTGGQVFADTNDIGSAVAEAMKAGADYYTIGYVPHFRKNDESFHRLKVKVTNGDHADYRNGYYADTAAVDPHPEHAVMAAAILDNGPPVSALRFQVRVRRLTEPESRAARLGGDSAWEIDYAVPVGQVDFETRAGGLRRARLEFVAVAYGANGKNLKFADERAEVRLPAADYQRLENAAMPIRQTIAVPPSALQMRVVVHDLQDGKIGATQVPLIHGSRNRGGRRR